MLLLTSAALVMIFPGWVTQSENITGDRLPPRECNLSIKAPVRDWYEGIPLGNGQLGALIWGRDNRLTVKLNRLDIWDERCNPLFKSDEFNWKTIQEYREAGNFTRINEVFGDHYWNEPPTHIAMGKLELILRNEARATFFELDLAQAEGIVQYHDGTRIKAIASASEPVILMLVPGETEGFEMWAPGMNNTWMESLGYPSPVMGRDHNSCWYEQTIQEGITYGYNGTGYLKPWKFAVFARKKKIGSNTLIAITITFSIVDGDNPLETARARTDKALATGYDKILSKHKEFWASFWGTSSIDIPDRAILKHYYLTRYYFGSSSRPGFPAMATLMSIWTDNKMFPDFKNDLHNDLETQAQYQAYQTAGNFEEGRVLYDYLWELLPTFRSFASSFYETSGAAVPGVMTYGGNPTTGWCQYTLSPTQAGWFGWLFYQHWRYTQDLEFLKNRAYPWCKEIAECWSQLLKPDANGVMKLPLSTSPEIFSNTPRAWLKPNSNYDLDLMQVHLLGLSEMAQALDKMEESRRWIKMAYSLGPRHIDEEDVLMYSENEQANSPHRHFSHSMSIHPFNLLTIDGSKRDRQIVAATMRNYDKTSSTYQTWTGWSFPWMSSIRSRIGQAESAYKFLDIFIKGWITRNGFHMNTDLHGVTPITGQDWLFTIEGNMLANQAVHDMLLQSWAPGIGKGEPGIIRLFPSTPWNWHNASFEDLRAEGGFRISAKWVNNQTVWFKVTAEADGLLRIRDNFGGRMPEWTGPEMLKTGSNFEKQMRKGETIEATINTPDEWPVKPIDIYTPIAPLDPRLNNYGCNQ